MSASHIRLREMHTKICQVGNCLLNKISCRYGTQTDCVILVFEESPLPFCRHRDRRLWLLRHTPGTCDRGTASTNHWYPRPSSHFARPDVQSSWSLGRTCGYTTWHDSEPVFFYILLRCKIDDSCTRIVGYYHDGSGCPVCQLITIYQ